ncbi:SusC/RagA family TonB-linked outer membrane protein [Butyricimonas virosa]|uniref:SusC/RagA family TonB-linked outer membrane protein n=3 Tax=Butyricimonas virosa TaxID=544645 RepID=A0A413IR96_9BACT|nr:SusC/RagA family TonB-linked outer membrane protein [Butyricimonas virosa]MCI7390283.1 SusC/RagA family TonB-linked outer membrane protein [Butyricimonas virosa]MDY4906585.1 SusC/RagA family TonB-linked outer membrane protein [Butyricimonas virosa]RGY19996.1 SusC/RagA family TonB-linked outer membrane protein [Butyricimonas virosa]RHI24013.1 SusC/RagA family TonB-linked outer membrane protein [Butyricimonas virosa]
MKKIRTSGFFRRIHGNFLLMMRLTMLFLLMTFVSLTATALGQRTTIKLDNVDLQVAFNEIKQKMGYTFVYNDQVVKNVGKVSVNVTSSDIKYILAKCLEGTSLDFYIEDNIVVIKSKAEQARETERKPVTVKGKVVDEKKQPLPGVTVLLKGTTLGVTTGGEGDFSIVITDTTKAELVFSFIGMVSQTIPYKSIPKGEWTIVLKDDVQEMDEVVVTGIYSRKKESFTGSSTTYTAKELKTIGNQNVLQSLKTMDPSFAIVENNQFGSDPNRLPDINVRGKTSVIGLTQEYEVDPNQPLFILDGFETTLKTISDLSMDRVQSITVLKDAAATAIYGSKAANGVVVVETKAPAPGTLRLTYNGNLNLSFADLSDYNLMNSKEKLEFERLAGYYGDLDANGEIESEYYQRLYYQRLAEVKRGVDTYWMSEPLRFATSHSHNLFAEGGDDRMRYGLGFSYNKTQGVMKGSDRDVINGNVQLLYRYKSLSFKNYLNLDYSMSSREKVAFSKFSQANPYHRKKNEDGVVEQVLEIYTDSDANSPTYLQELKNYNPLYDMTLGSSDETSSFGFTNNFEIDWQVFDGLRAKGRFSISKSTDRGEVFKSPNASDYAETASTERGSYRETRDENLSYDGDLNVTYAKLFNEVHMVNAVGGIRLASSKSQSSGYESIGFIDDRYSNPSFSSGYPTGGKPSYFTSEKRSASYYLNAGYAYDDRYLLDVNLRSDGSSVFGLSQQFTTTWAIGLAWNVHKEDFFQNQNWLNFLKLRFSIGNPGNQNFDAYISMNVYKYATGYPNPFGVSAIVSTWGNNDLDWQKTIDQNYGIDLAFLNNRLKVTVDYFYKNTDPLLVYVQTPTSTGTSTVPMNLGKQVSQGLTATLNYMILQRENMSWNFNFNARHITYEYRNIGTALDKFNQENRSSNLVRYYDGGSPSDLWAVRSAGIDPASGREIFIKKDGTQTFEHDYADEVVVGNSDPKVEGVIGTSFYYKGFSASVNLRYRLGGQIFMSTLYDKVENISENALQYNQDKRALYDRWQKPGDVSKYKSISLTDATPMSSRFIADENTLSGESISFGYETQAKWLHRIGASSMTIRGYMNDIFRISTVKNERGLDYPFARTVAFSLGLTF